MSTYTYTTLVDEARLAINMKGTEKVFTDAEIKRWIFARLRSVETTYTFQKISTTLFAMLGSSDYGFWLWNPTITGVDVTGTATGASSPTILIDSNATFITDGITVGQTVTLDVGGNTATVASIQSETQLTSTALSATGSYDAGEAYTITTAYLINARGSIEVTAGAHIADSIAVTGALVDFSTVIVDICQWLATHRAQEISEAMGGGSYNSSGVYSQLMQIAEKWQGITGI